MFAQFIQSRRVARVGALAKPANTRRCLMRLSGPLIDGGSQVRGGSKLWLHPQRLFSLINGSRPQAGLILLLLPESVRLPDAQLVCGGMFATPGRVAREVLHLRVRGLAIAVAVSQQAEGIHALQEPLILGVRDSGSDQKGRSQC